eukprot:CAMPEP_0178374938 /NCGR_PEP_ID=MMETSP0689_2-20121128/2630_1 /TAXON_ID=160604 /ORGANISM="Amphidinium massartii, Strain CS-259" /LENGTH=414 /DNA_ID=CAMNT_0019994915 /DNA_START=23 /DNA_END=1263 /DNA_ORIENTATION=+
MSSAQTNTRRTASDRESTPADAPDAVSKAPTSRSSGTMRSRRSNGGTTKDVTAEDQPEDDPGQWQGEGEEDEGTPPEEGEEDNLDDCEWEELAVSPLHVRFTQEKIHPFFFRRGPIVNVVPKIRIVPRDAGGDEPELELVPPFTMIRCLRKGDELWSLDNRRLYALQLAAMQCWPRQCYTKILATERLPRRKLKTQYRKFQTQSEGRAVHICARYQQFDTWSWFDRAVETEWYYLSHRLGLMLSVFEIFPVAGALLYRTGLTCFTSRITYLVAFVMAFATDLVRQKVPAIEKGICSLHVKAILDGDVRSLWPFGSKGTQALVANDGEESPVTSAPQLAVMMAVALVLLLPYLFSITIDKLRSALFSCWLGIACVLAVQLRMSIRDHADVDGDLSGVTTEAPPQASRLSAETLSS